MNFQQSVQRWILQCFGIQSAYNRTERNHRFLEEALELVQAAEYSEGQAAAMVQYVFGRDPGGVKQEVGGVLNSLAAFCCVYDLDMLDCGQLELERRWLDTEEIRRKNAAKPPEASPESPKVFQEQELGYANVYQDKDGEVVLGATDLCPRIDSEFRGIAAEHFEYLGRAKVVLVSDH